MFVNIEYGNYIRYGIFFCVLSLYYGFINLFLIDFCVKFFVECGE